jgi:tetratricopeptide (TPR) repeat protein
MSAARPTHPKLAELLRSLYVLEFARARTQVDELLDEDPPRGRLADSIFAFYLGDFEEAAAGFDACEEDGLEDAELFQYRAFTLKELGRLHEAAVSLEHGLALHPGDETLASELGRVYTELGEPRKALERLRDEPGRNPSYEALRSRGQALERLGSLEAALEEYQKALRDFPFDADLMTHVRELAIQLGVAEQAAQFFAALVRKRQLDRLPALHNLGLLNLHLNRAHRVDEVCRNLEGLVPNDHFALVFLVDLLARLGKTKKIKTLTMRCAGDEVLPEIRAELLAACARIYLHEGQEAKAREAVRQGLALAPFHPGLKAFFS